MNIWFAAAWCANGALVGYVVGHYAWGQGRLGAIYGVAVAAASLCMLYLVVAYWAIKYLG